MQVFSPTWSIVLSVDVVCEVSLEITGSIVCSAAGMCEGELCCLGHRRKVSALCLLYKIYHRADHPLHEYLHHFVAARNTRGSAAVCELALLIPRCRIDQFTPSFLPVAVVCGTCCRQMFSMMVQ